MGLESVWNKQVKSFLYKGYSIFYKNIFFRKELARIRHYYEIIRPGDYYDIGIGTMKIFLKSTVISMVVFLFALLMMKKNLYSYIMSILMSILLKQQIIMSGIEREEYKLLKQFERFLGEVRHHYTFQGSVEEALDYSLEEAEYDISLHINRIYEILLSGEACDLTVYKNTVPHKLLVTFLGLCQTTIIYGDTIKDEKSMFLTNLASMKREMNTEILKKDKIRYTFSGLLFIAILPVFFLEKIEHWGTSNIPSLSLYYQGGYGITVAILIFFLTYIAYQFILLLKATTHIKYSQYTLLERLTQVKWIQRCISFWYQTYPLKGKKICQLLKKAGDGMTLPQYLIQVGLIQIVSFLMIQFIIGNIVIQSKWNAIHYGSGLYESSAIEKRDKLEKYQQVIWDNANEYKGYSLNMKWWKKIIYSQENISKLKEAIRDNIRNHNSDIYIGTVDILTEEAMDRIIRYQSYYYRWYLLPLSCLFSIGLGYVPKLILYFKIFLRDSIMEDEVLSFYSIILMLMYIPMIHVSIILEWLEIFSEVFQESLIECVDNYTYDEEIAFENLIEQEPYLPFVRLIQNLEACDKVGIERAFDELAGQRGFLIEKRKQDNEIQISNKGVIGKVVAYVPLFVTISLYLIIPFVLESIRMFMNYVNQMNAY